MKNITKNIAIVCLLIALPVASATQPVDNTQTKNYLISIGILNADGSYTPGWKYKSPQQINLQNTADQVGIGVPLLAGAGGPKFAVQGDNAFTSIEFFTGGTNGHFIAVGKSSGSTFVIDDDDGRVSMLTSGIVTLYKNGDFVTNDNLFPWPQATNAGFLYLPQCTGGPPTGAPTPRPGTVPLMYGADGKLYHWPNGIRSELATTYHDATTGFNTVSLTNCPGAVVKWVPCTVDGVQSWLMVAQ